MDDFYQCLSAIARIARESGFVWEVRMSGSTRTVHSWSDDLHIGVAEERILETAAVNRLVTRRRVGRDLLLGLTDRGIRTLLERADSGCELVDWVRRSRAALAVPGLEVKSKAILFNEVDRIERSLHVFLNSPGGNVDAIYHQIAGELHKFLIDEKGKTYLSSAAKAPLGKRRRNALRMSLSDVYIGPADLYHAFANTLPDAPEDIPQISMMGGGNVLMATGAFGISSPHPGLVAMTTSDHLSRSDWLSQNLICTRGEIQSIRTIISNIRDTVSSHVLPHDSRRDPIDTLESSLSYGEMHGASAYVRTLAIYAIGLMRVFRLSRELTSVGRDDTGTTT